jgi:hypothetical protein
MVFFFLHEYPQVDIPSSNSTSVDYVAAEKTVQKGLVISIRKNSDFHGGGLLVQNTLKVHTVDVSETGP